mmetsp:Transcript_125017/g.176443  ORF Transcript_125017/g.176443 Transcript_125017/m.176443 type:complete len:98 (+) Transcript_125017:173-466(+)
MSYESCMSAPSICNLHSTDWSASPDAWMASSGTALSIYPTCVVHSTTATNTCSTKSTIHGGCDQFIQPFHCVGFAGGFDFEHRLTNWSMGRSNCRTS